MERSGGITIKIEEKAKGNSATYPMGRLTLNEEE